MSCLAEMLDLVSNRVSGLIVCRECFIDNLTRMMDWVFDWDSGAMVSGRVARAICVQ